MKWRGEENLPSNIIQQLQKLKPRACKQLDIRKQRKLTQAPDTCDYVFNTNNQYSFVFTLCQAQF